MRNQLGRFISGVVICILFAASADTAQAQLERNPGGFGWMRIVPASLTAYESVQKDLQLNPEAVAALAELHGGPDRLARKYESVQAKVREILTPAQMTRLWQIHLQLKGNSALADPLLEADLAFTPDQYRGIQDEHAAFNKEFIRHLKGGDDDELNSDAKIGELEAKLKAERNARWFLLLTAEQRAAFEKLKGAPFDFSTLKK